MNAAPFLWDSLSTGENIRKPSSQGDCIKGRKHQEICVQVEGGIQEKKLPAVSPRPLGGATLDHCLGESVQLPLGDRVAELANG
jgi:hypothetical protein